MSHQTLLDRIPEVPDVQSAWLLLSYCAAARANFFLRSVDPDESEEFAQAHDEGVWRCFSRIMGLSPSCDARIQASLPRRRFGFAECHAVQASSPLGQLG